MNTPKPNIYKVNRFPGLVNEDITSFLVRAHTHTQSLVFFRTSVPKKNSQKSVAIKSNRLTRTQIYKEEKKVARTNYSFAFFSFF